MGEAPGRMDANAETPPTDEALRQHLRELNDDLRLALPGVQVLFAFLLTLPFTSRATLLENDIVERLAYLIAFLLAAASSIFMIAPSALHRVYHELSNPGGLETLFRVSARLAVVGTILLALSMSAAVFMVLDVFFSRSTAAVTAAPIVALVSWFWFGYPLLRRLDE